MSRDLHKSQRTAPEGEDAEDGAVGGGHGDAEVGERLALQFGQLTKVSRRQSVDQQAEEGTKERDRRRQAVLQRRRRR